MPYCQTTYFTGLFQQGGGRKIIWLNVLTVLSVLFKKAVEWQVIGRIPCTIRMLPIPKGSAGFYDFDEYERLVAAAHVTERTAYLITAWKLGSYYRTYPAYVEDEVKASLEDPSHFVRGPLHLMSHGTSADDSAAFCVEDDKYVSARWPGDAYLFAKKILERV